MITAHALAACMLTASNMYNVPAAVMIGIMHVEGGYVGQKAGPNINGSYDLGPMQVNSLWVPKLARLWNVDQRTAQSWLQNDGCVNVHVGAWILKQRIVEAKGNLYGGIAHYHSYTPSLGAAYATKVIVAMDKKGLINHDAPLPIYKYNQYAQK